MSKIKTVHVKNLKAITEVVANFNGCSAIVIGGNNKGKSTLLNALRERLHSMKPEFIVRIGEKDGLIETELTTGEKFIWEFNVEGRDRLTFISKEGLQRSLTKEIINKYFNPKFDIDKFLNVTPKEQGLMLQKLVGIDFSKIDAEYKEAYDTRTCVNRLAADAKSKVVPINHLPDADKIIDISALQKEIAAAIDNNRTGQQVLKEIEFFQSEVEKFTKQLAYASDQLIKHKEIAANLKVIDIDLKEKEFATAIESNKKAEANLMAKELADIAKKHEVAITIADEQVQMLIQKKKDMLTACKLPDGIAITDDGIRVDGLPLNELQLSTSKLYIIALKLAALNLAEVKCLTFDASPLDRTNLEEIQAWANANDLQLLIEKPDFDGGEISYQLIEEVKYV